VWLAFYHITEPWLLPCWPVHTSLLGMILVVTRSCLWLGRVWTFWQRHSCLKSIFGTEALVIIVTSLSYIEEFWSHLQLYSKLCSISSVEQNINSTARRSSIGGKDMRGSPAEAELTLVPLPPWVEWLVGRSRIYRVLPELVITSFGTREQPFFWKVLYYCPISLNRTALPLKIKKKTTIHIIMKLW
jgi:hypothetical protein